MELGVVLVVDIVGFVGIPVGEGTVHTGAIGRAAPEAGARFQAGNPLPITFRRNIRGTNPGVLSPEFVFNSIHFRLAGERGQMALQGAKGAADSR